MVSSDSYDYDSVVTCFLNTYKNMLNGITSGNPTKIVGSLKMKLMKLVKTYKTNVYVSSMLFGSVIIILIVLVGLYISLAQPLICLLQNHYMD